MRLMFRFPSFTNERHFTDFVEEHYPDLLPLLPSEGELHIVGGVSNPHDRETLIDIGKELGAFITEGIPSRCTVL